MTIRTKREEQNISQAELAKRVGITRAYLCQLEKGVKSNPSARILIAIAKELGVSADVLMVTEAA